MRPERTRNKRYVYRPPTSEDMRRRLSERNGDRFWQSVEDDYGPLESVEDDKLKRTLRTHLDISEILGTNILPVPTEVARRVFTDLIDKFRRSAKAANSIDAKRAIISVNRDLEAWVSTLPRRERNRPRKNWFQQALESEAVRELELRRRQLKDSGLTSNEAINKAAAEIAPDYQVKPATLISWWKHPGRLRRPRKH